MPVEPADSVEREESRRLQPTNVKAITAHAQIANSITSVPRERSVERKFTKDISLLSPSCFTRIGTAGRDKCLTNQVLSVIQIYAHVKRLL